MALVLVIALIFPAVSVFADEDDHYIQLDDYFISKDAFKDQDWIYVTLAKMTKAATKDTKNEAQFLQIRDGKAVWTKYFWTTRLATQEDLKLGMPVILADIAGDEDIYRAPDSKDESRSTSWFLAKITDLSDLYKEFVTVSGGYKASIGALRVIVKDSQKK